MTSIEKDRYQLESIRIFMDLNETQKVLFEIADRLLTEKENGVMVYQEKVEVAEPFSDENYSKNEIGTAFQ
ncbi:hypothetical protein [Listeria booriae]|uniref:Uncharacterized protein n=1 Tax=Listeria booriae TaxID=1552123 RepID=A0A842G9T5_9LIST|nr:hypothetical protein [Listeria booriae]MBC2258861.1 hypothetical protein [Listeria booriae]MBC2292962.1 hypothetical protein [Listeria booriae]MBC2676252.1 hypothetical protein [Listeria booriae]MDT0111644.1 hypothetical protein [Listeria booriae]